jgi:hypothetical protein
VVTNLGAAATFGSGLSDAALAPDGGIIAVGQSDSSAGDTELALARYIG